MTVIETLPAVWYDHRPPAPYLYRVARENAKKLIRAWNSSFNVLGLDSMSDEALLYEFAHERELFLRGLRRVPIQHVSKKGLLYQPRIDYIGALLDGNGYIFCKADDYDMQVFDPTDAVNFLIVEGDVMAYHYK